MAIPLNGLDGTALNYHVMAWEWAEKYVPWTTLLFHQICQLRKQFVYNLDKILTFQTLIVQN